MSVKDRPSSDRLLAELDAMLGPPPPAYAPPPRPARPAPAVTLAPAAPLEEKPPPVAPAALAVAAAAAPPRAAPRVLIVEDDKDYRKVLRYLLTTSGYAVDEAGNGAEGLNAARARMHDLAILDFEMPRMNGYELLQELRRHDDTRKLPVILLTGAPNRKQLREIGMDVVRFLDKPIPNADLISVVSSLITAVPSPLPLPLPADIEPIESEVPSLDDEDEGSELLIEEQKKEDREEDVSGLEVLANDSPIVNRINKALVQAVEMGASDVHIEPQEKVILVRVRVDGAMRLLCKLPIALHAQVATRIKIMSNLTITERRRPQDGQVRAIIRGRKIEFRVSTLPSLYGEKVVLRILGGAKLKEKLEELQFCPHDLEATRRGLQCPHGLLLVTGPTGSGKSTTLYTMIRQLNTPDVNIVTAEDPVEYELAGITQVPIRANIGVTFEAVLRSFLRQDPDIMLVGEIRDLETAEIAVKAAITGHIVLSTLHTNSAPATISRLTHMGLAPYLVADSVKLVIAQRLVRRICAKCSAPAPADDEMLRLIGTAEKERLSRACSGRGCVQCDRTGYKGRMPIFEVMEIRTPEMRDLILADSGADEIAKQAAREGMRSLREAALDAVAAGETTVQEALNLLLAD